MKLSKEQLNGISSIIRNYSKFGYIPEFKTFMNLLNDKKFNNLLRRNSPIELLEKYLQDNKNRFHFGSVESSPETIIILYHLGNKGLYGAYAEILTFPPTIDMYGVELKLYYKES